MDSNIKAVFLAKARAKALENRPVLLLVDDDEQVLTSLKMVLKSEYDVHTSANAAASIDVFRTVSPQVVVLDVKMPEHDGFWVMQQLGKINPRVPIVLNSGFQKQHDFQDALGTFKPFAYLTKSGSLTDFMTTIRNAVNWHVLQHNQRKSR